MEGLASNFELVLEDFQKRLHGATYAAVDMELSGTSIESLPDSYAESVTERFSKMCAIAEKHVPIQIGITLVKHDGQCLQCSSYSFYVRPWVGIESLDKERNFMCTASAMRFNADNEHVDFNKWQKHGVPYMSREDELRYLASGASRDDVDVSQKTGLLRVWKSLCEACVPLVTHCPLDVFFLLSCFEKRKLPRDPKEFAALLSRCLPCVFDTAHLHSVIGDFPRLKLVEFLEDAATRHAERSISPIHFGLAHETMMRYGNGGDLAHDAGFDSLCTAQLYAYLLDLAPELVGCNANRLFLFKSVHCLDLFQSACSDEAGSSAFSKDTEIIAVAKLQHSSDMRVVKAISTTGFFYKKMDDSHFLLLGQRSRIPELKSLTRGVDLVTFEEWRSQVRLNAFVGTAVGDSIQSAAPVRSVGSHCLVESSVRSGKESTRAGSETEPRYCGRIKSFNPACGGYGFITCLETDAVFVRDVFFYTSQLEHPRIGQEVIFTVSVNSRGQPKAEDLIAVHRQSQRATNVEFSDADVDEARTTIGASSDYASISDFGSPRDDAGISYDSTPKLASLAWLGGMHDEELNSITVAGTGPVYGNNQILYRAQPS